MSGENTQSESIADFYRKSFAAWTAHCDVTPESIFGRIVSLQYQSGSEAARELSTSFACHIDYESVETLRSEVRIYADVVDVKLDKQTISKTLIFTVT